MPTYLQNLQQEREEPIRRIVREEIVKALQALAREAEDQDMPYETGELESAALRAIGRVMEGTVGRLTCPHEGYYPQGFSDSFMAGTRQRCDRCGEPEPEPENPFEGPPTDGAPYPGKARTCPVGPDICGDIIGWEPFLAHIYHTHTSVEQTEEERQNAVQTILRRGRGNG